MPEPKHDGCYFCGNRDQLILKSKPIFNIISQHGKQLAPHSVAICDSAHCQAQDKIDYRERKAGTVF